MLNLVTLKGSAMSGVEPDLGQRCHIPPLQSIDVMNKVWICEPPEEPIR